MTPQNEIQPRIWQIAGHEIRIAFPEGVLEALRVTARLQSSRGVASATAQRGLLMGERCGAEIYTNGSLPPGAAQPDPDSSVVGWYAIRPDPEISLTASDVAHMGRFGAPSYEIALIIRPAGNDAVRVGVFFQEEDGNIRSASSYCEMLVLPASSVSIQSPMNERDVKARRPTPQRAMLPPNPVATPVVTPALNAPAVTNTAPLIPRRWGSLVLGSFVGVILLMVTLIEFHTVHALSGAAMSSHEPSAPAVVIPPPPPPAEAAPAMPASSLPTSGDAVVTAPETQRLNAELAFQREHNRRMELFVQELRERDAAKTAGRSRTAARSRFAVRLEP